jgi:3'-phosphoadenosine 5'-phosphosulfate sulfotransferase (PAPS reductase)/FAD synthetase
MIENTIPDKNVKLKNIISLSGGKDSTCLLLKMLEMNESIHSVVFFDTGWEFPEMIEHIDKIEKYTGLDVVRLKYMHTFDYMLLEHYIPQSGKSKKPRKGYGWPSAMRRWCTGRKVQTIEKYYRKQHNFISCIGFAADEAKRVPVISKKKWPERYPLIEWDVSEKEALQYCYNHGFDWGGLYELFGRVSCYCCPLQRICELRNLRKYRPELWSRMLIMGKNQNRGFKGWKTVQDFENRFAEEDRQLDLFPNFTCKEKT